MPGTVPELQPAGSRALSSATIATAMEPASPARSPDLFVLADRLSPYGPWLHIALALRDVRTSRWPGGGGRRYGEWLMAQRERIRRAGWFN
jgi:hypothetical protein